MTGYLHIITGCMFSGKTTELIKQKKRLSIYRKNIYIIKHKCDNRALDNMTISTHDENIYLKADFEFDNNCNIYDQIDFNKLRLEYDTIILDEAQFYIGLIDFVEKLLQLEFYIVIGGLDGDYRQKKFGEILDLIPIADEYTKLRAICPICNDGTYASFTKRIVNNNDKIYIGGKDSYIPVCRKHI